VRQELQLVRHQQSRVLSERVAQHVNEESVANVRICITTTTTTTSHMSTTAETVAHE
jgi:hypothetical protein